MRDQRKIEAMLVSSGGEMVIQGGSCPPPPQLRFDRGEFFLTAIPSRVAQSGQVVGNCDVFETGVHGI